MSGYVVWQAEDGPKIQDSETRWSLTSALLLRTVISIKRYTDLYKLGYITLTAIRYQDEIFI